MVNLEADTFRDPGGLSSWCLNGLQHRPGPDQVGHVEAFREFLVGSHQDLPSYLAALPLEQPSSVAGGHRPRRGRWDPRVASTVYVGKMSSTNQLGAFALYVFDLRDGSDRLLASRFPSDFAMGVSWSPDGKHLAYLAKGSVIEDDSSEVFVVSCEGVEEPKLLASGDYFRETRAPTGLTLALCCCPAKVG